MSKETTRVAVCEACGKECEPVENDHGGYEEVWGAKVWVPAWTTESDCCHEYFEYKDLTDEERDNLETNIN